MKKDERPIIVDQSFNCSIETLWDAITQVDQMRSWFFDNIPSFKPEVGFAVQFNVKTPEREFLHLWEIIEVIPCKKIVYNWRYKNYQGDSTVEFALFTHKDKTILQVISTVLEEFPDDIPEFKRESGVAGWTFFIQDNLKRYLDRE